MRRCFWPVIVLLLWGLSSCGTVSVPATAVPVPSMSPTPRPTVRPTPIPTPTPTPTPMPTPTPDPLDQYFAAEGEQIIRQDFETWDTWLYQDHDLCVDIEKFVDAEARQTYYVADIRVRNGIFFTSGFPNADKPGRCGTRLPYRLARQYKAIYAQNGDFMLEEKETKGILIKNGSIIYEGKRQDTLALMPDGDMRVYSPGEITAAELIDMGVMNTYSFGPTLIRDGEINPDMNKHRVAKLKNPRSALGMVEPGHYIAIVVEGRDPKRSVGMTCEELAALFESYGCTVAYNLDGGASSSMVFLGNSLITHETYYFGQRSVPDILMLGVCELVPDENAATQYTGIGDNCPEKPTSTPMETAMPEPTDTPAPPATQKPTSPVTQEPSVSPAD